LGFRIRRFARENRKSRIVRRIARQCEKFLHGFYNQGFYDFATNGEACVIEAAAEAVGTGPLLVFDVGANRGEWARIVAARKPDAVIYCFEIVPATVALLRDAMVEHPTVHICDYGLFSAAGDVEVSWNRASDHTSAITRWHDDAPIESDAAVVASRVDTGDAVVRRTGLGRIDLLKIDVEGREIEVLTGFRDTIASPELRPRLIQFEYGVTWLPARHTLKEAFGLLEPAGYLIGRLYPDGVDFKRYTLLDDHFRMGNYVAAQADDPLLRRLSEFRRR
jgi:FkbM family methyltransferase